MVYSYIQAALSCLDYCFSAISINAPTTRAGWTHHSTSNIYLIVTHQTSAVLLFGLVPARLVTDIYPRWRKVEASHKSNAAVWELISLSPDTTINIAIDHAIQSKPPVVWLPSFDRESTRLAHVQHIRERQNKCIIKNRNIK